MLCTHFQEKSFCFRLQLTVVTLISVSSSNTEDFVGDLSYKEEKVRTIADLDAPARTPNGRTPHQFEPVQPDGSAGADVEAANGDGPN